MSKKHALAYRMAEGIHGPASRCEIFPHNYRPPKSLEDWLKDLDPTKHLPETGEEGKASLLAEARWFVVAKVAEVCPGSR